MHRITTGVLGAIVLCFTFLFPESPRWLALGGDCDRPRAVLAAVLGDDPNSDYINTVLNNIIYTNEETAASASFGSLFTMGKEKMLYRLLLACSVQWFSQMSGSALITYYSNQLFATIGLSSDLSKIMGASVLTFKAACTLIPIATIERAGRRRLFMISGTGMATCMVSPLTLIETSPTAPVLTRYLRLSSRPLHKGRLRRHRFRLLLCHLLPDRFPRRQLSLLPRDHHYAVPSPCRRCIDFGPLVDCLRCVL